MIGNTWRLALCALLAAAMAACGPAEELGTLAEPGMKVALGELNSDGEDAPTLRSTQAAAPGCAVQYPGAVYDVRAYGALGDSVTDDRLAIQRAVDAAIAAGGGTVLFPGNADGSKRVYKLSLAGSGTPSSPAKGISIYGGPTGIKPVNLRLLMQPGVRLKAIPNTFTAYGLIYIRQASNVTIQGGYLVGDKYTTTYVGNVPHDMAHGILVDRSINVKVDDVRVLKFPGDGIYIDTHPEETAVNPAGFDGVEVCRSVVSDNGRTGVAIITGDGVRVRDSNISWTGFVSGLKGDWQSGVDIEPNDPYAGGWPQYAQDIRITNTDIANNAGAGVMLHTAAGSIRDVRILDGILESNGRGYVSSGSYWAMDTNILVGPWGAQKVVTDLRINRNILRKGTGLGYGSIDVNSASSGTVQFNDLTQAGSPRIVQEACVTVIGNTGAPDQGC